MKILAEFPPNYEKIIATFPAVAKEQFVLFTYGDTIYNPSGKEIPPCTIAHEEVHSREQLAVGAAWWWDQYLGITEFRFNEELMAYRVEWKEFCNMYQDRNERASFLQFIAMNLSGPLYGNMCTLTEAKRKIRFFELP